MANLDGPCANEAGRSGMYARPACCSPVPLLTCSSPPSADSGRSGFVLARRDRPEAIRGIPGPCKTPGAGCFRRNQLSFQPSNSLVAPPTGRAHEKNCLRCADSFAGRDRMRSAFQNDGYGEDTRHPARATGHRSASSCYAQVAFPHPPVPGMRCHRLGRGVLARTCACTRQRA